MLVGVDGCADGWVCLASHDGQLEAFVVADLFELVERVPVDAVVAIDVPIGLPEKGSRRCDLEARKLLGAPRASSVFPAPVRACLRGADYEEACDLHAAADGRRLTRQAFGILPKIREVDALLTTTAKLQERVIDVHPEVSFREWAGRPMVHHKRRDPGRAEREALIEAVWPGERDRLAAALGRVRFHQDDLNDAFAALWSAERIAAGTARQLGSPPEFDSLGVRMRIVA